MVGVVVSGMVDMLFPLAIAAIGFVVLEPVFGIVLLLFVGPVRNLGLVGGLFPSPVSSIFQMHFIV